MPPSATADPIPTFQDAVTAALATHAVPDESTPAAPVAGDEVDEGADPDAATDDDAEDEGEGDGEGEGEGETPTEAAVAESALITDDAFKTLQTRYQSDPARLV